MYCKISIAAGKVIFSGFFIVVTRRSTAADIIVSGLSLLINNNNIMFKLNIMNVYTYIIG